MSNENPRTLTYDQAISELKKECRNRPVVPFLGAGISLSAGFPAIGAVVEYLAKVDFAIQSGVYSHRYPERIAKIAQIHKEHPSRFLRDFGWPDLGQLDADLWDWLERPRNHALRTGSPIDALGFGQFNILHSDRRAIASNEQIRQQHIHQRRITNASRRELTDRLSCDLCHCYYHIQEIGDNDPAQIVLKPTNSRALDMRDHLRAISQWRLRHDLRLRETGISKAAMREWMLWKRWYHASENAPERQPDLLYGDWESLLDRLCEGDFDLVDTLFTSLEEGREPTTAHRYATFLHGRVEMPLILTTNFDTLLERSFRDLGTQPKVFDIHRDADLPDADLVRRAFSILKLHGSSYGLRLGERLRSPIELEAQSDVLQYLPNDALVIVLGFSGSERRIMQLLHAIATSSSTRHRRRILWLKGPGPSSMQLEQLAKECGDRVSMCEISDAGAFLQDWYFAYAQGYQSSPVTYSALGGRPIPDVSSEGVFSILEPSKRSLARKPVQLFTRANTNDPTVSSCATLAAGDFVTSLGHRYHPIWIDLESHHTVSGIVAELFEHFRKVDPESPRFGMVDSADGTVSVEVLKKVVDRIGEVLERGRYVIVFDSLESFGRTQMMHHGIPTYELLLRTDQKQYKILVDEFRQRVKTIQQFLHLLLYPNCMCDPELSQAREQKSALRYFRDSYVLLSIDKERPRQLIHPSADPLLLKGAVSNAKDDGLRTRSPEPETISVVRDSIAYFRDFQHDASHMQFNRIASEVDEGDSSNDWQADPESNNELRVVSRVASILSLKQVVADLSTTSSNGTESECFTKKTLDSLLAVLSVFRRPRTVPMVRSITERWLLPDKGYLPPKSTVRDAHDVIDVALKMLHSEARIVIHQGGRIRLRRHVHEQYYGAMTESLHLGGVILGWQARYSCNATARALTVIDALVAASLHFAAARTMFVDVYLLTRDVQAFYEYMYHRVAVLKILCVAQGLLCIPFDTKTRPRARESVQEEVIRTIRMVSESVESGNDQPTNRTAWNDSQILTWFLDAIGLSGVVRPPWGEAFISKDGLSQYVHLLRQHALQTVSLAVRRNEQLLRAVAAPDTLLGWARQFDQREHADISGLVYDAAQRKGLLGKVGRQDVVRAVCLNNPAEMALKEALGTFGKLEARSCFAKMDFLTVLGKVMGAKHPTDKSFVGRANAYYRMVEKKSMALNAVGVTDSKQAEEMTSDEMSQVAAQLERWHLGARCMLHLGWNAQALRIVNWGKSRLINMQASQIVGVKESCRAMLREYTELEAKMMLGVVFQPWHALDDQWRFDDSSESLESALSIEECTSTDECRNVDGQSDRMKERVKALMRAEELAVEYETLLRETSRTASEDTRHRSSAYLLRARSLYLRGHFRTAHRYLDLASSGTKVGDVDQAVGQAAIHLARTELLVYSAHEHLRRFDAMRQNCSTTREEELDEIAKEGAKLRRAESEVDRAACVLENVRHQTTWSVRMHIGQAQVRFERVLLSIEEFVRGSRGLDDNAFSRSSGQLEQSVLSGMRHLRSALDLLPYVGGTWVECRDSSVRRAPMIRDEQLIYALWIQFYVVSRFYWAVLRRWNHGAKSYDVHGAERSWVLHEIVTEVSGGANESGEVTWQMWCNSLRFGKIAGTDIHGWLRATIDRLRMRSFQSQEGRGEQESGDRSAVAYSVAPLRLIILSVCGEMCSDDNLATVWNARRGVPLT